MGAAAAKAKPKINTNALGHELLTLFKKNADDLKRIDEIKSTLKTNAQVNYKIDIAGLGTVTVSAPKDKTFKGTVPKVVAEAFLGLTETKRKKLLDDGLVVMENEYTGQYYGSVTTKLF